MRIPIDTDRVLRYAILLGAAFFLSGCGMTMAPENWLPEAGDRALDPYGGWIEMTVSPDRPDGKRRDIEGELVAIDADSIWVLPCLKVRPRDYDSRYHRRPSVLHWQPVIAISTDRIRKAEVEGFASRPENATGLATLGVFSTLTHGFFLIFTAPVWMLGGSALSFNQADLAREKWAGPESVEALGRYARFPRGWPRGLDPVEIKPRPFERNAGAETEKAAL